MRKVQFRRFIPTGGFEEHEKDLLSFIKTEGYLASFLNYHKDLPPIAELNRILNSGSGDDGFIIMKWAPFTVNEKEYKELSRLVKKKSN